MLSKTQITCLSLPWAQGMRLCSGTWRALPCVSLSLPGHCSIWGAWHWKDQCKPRYEHTVLHRCAEPPPTCCVGCAFFFHIAGKGQGSSPACPRMTSSSISLGIALAPSGGGTSATTHGEEKKDAFSLQGSWFEQVGLWMCRRFSALLWAHCSSMCAPVLSSIGQGVGQGFEPCYCKAQLCFFPT